MAKSNIPATNNETPKIYPFSLSYKLTQKRKLSKSIILSDKTKNHSREICRKRKKELCSQRIFLKKTAQEMKFFIKGFFSNCDEIRSFLQIWSDLLKKSLMENFIFCAVKLKYLGFLLYNYIPEKIKGLEKRCYLFWFTF